MPRASGAQRRKRAKLRAKAKRMREWLARVAWKGFDA